MSLHLSSLPPPGILRPISRYAFFFDFDGTLAEIAEKPEAVRFEARAKEALDRLCRDTGGAVAIITGREADAVDAFFAPLRLAIAGVHGLELRKPDGSGRSAAVDEKAANDVETALAARVEAHPGLLLERKRGALALHYRGNPAREAECLRWMEEAAAPFRQVVLTRGKMVVEARFHRATKGTALLDFYAEAPFAGRVPVFAGDDVTDEDAFAAVNRFDGISIKVGEGATAARYRAKAVASFIDWLCRLARPPIKGESEA
jgi:trehalose 6-phosphate phosphatase